MQETGFNHQQILFLIASELKLICVDVSIYMNCVLQLLLLLLLLLFHHFVCLLLFLN